MVCIFIFHCVTVQAENYYPGQRLTVRSVNHHRNNAPGVSSKIEPLACADTSSEKRQLKTSEDDTQLCELQLSVNKFPDPAQIFRMNSPVKFWTNQDIKIGRRA